jgi:uncharacterized protein
VFVVDTNIFIYAAEKTFPKHRQAHAMVEQWMQNPEPWFVTWGILYEFMRVTTHSAVFSKPWSWNGAKSFVKALLASPGIKILTHTPNHFAVLEQVVSGYGEIKGNLIHDAHIAVLMKEHGIREIRTCDNHFLKFGFLKVVDPFL